MKKYFRIMALLACTAALCVSALAAGTEDPADHAYVPDPQYDVYWGTVTRQENGKLLVQKPGETAPTDGIVFWLREDTMILDAVTGEPVSAASVRDGSTVYAWTSGYTATTLSLPPQTIPEVLLVNIPADYRVPQYDVIVRADGLTSVGIPDRSGISVTLSDGSVYQVWEDAKITPYLTRNRVTCQDLLPGTRVLIWADDAGQAERVLVFPYAYPGYLALNGCGRLYINGTATLEPSALRRPYGDARLYAPIRAVAEAAGFQVSWDKEYGAVVKTDGGETVFFIRPDQKQAHGPAVSGQPSLSGPCLIADGVSYLELHDLARLLGLYYGG